jgi:uncharacterized protein YjaZ
VRQQAGIRDCLGKRSIYALKQGQEKARRLKTQTQSEQNLSSSDTTRNTKEKEKCKKKKYFNPSVMREKLSMAKGKPQQTGMTAEINSIPTYAI